ncbi:MAG: nuclear transport factor 2 family protein [Steroidobacteraceae bacterium]
MTKVGKTVALITLGLFGIPTWASGPTDMKGADTPNGRVVREFVDMEFNQHKPGEAFDKYVHKDYKNKYMGGPQLIQNNNFEGQKAAEVRVFGGPMSATLSLQIKKVIASEDFVFVQGLAKGKPDATGDQIWMLFRLKDGKIIEHWDLHAELPANSDPELYY